MKKPPEFCRWCNLSFGLAEQRTDYNGQPMHTDCFKKALNEQGKLQAKAKLAECQLIMARVSSRVQ